MQEPIVARAREASKSYSGWSMAGIFGALVPLSLILGVEFYYLPSEPGSELALHWCLIGVTLAGVAFGAYHLIRGLTGR